MRLVENVTAYNRQESLNDGRQRSSYRGKWRVLEKISTPKSSEVTSNAPEFLLVQLIKYYLKINRTVYTKDVIDWEWQIRKEEIKHQQNEVIQQRPYVYRHDDFLLPYYE